MRSRISKWVIPGIITVLLGTAAIVQFTKTDMEQDLASRSEQALSSAGMHWAKVHFDGRDALLSGVSYSQEQSEAATKIIADLHGVRSVVHTVDIAPLASPYPFAAKISGDEVTLAGGVPDEAARNSLLDIAKPADAELELLSGIENRAKWLAAAEFALRQLREMDEGQVALSDMKLSMSGRAKSRAAFEKISIEVNAGFPEDVERGEVDITPPLQSPFDWKAEFDGERITMRGYVPNSEAIEQIGKAVPDGIVMTPDILLASGAPVDFSANAAALTRAFAYVSEGSAEISDDKLAFSGDPTSPAAVAQIGETLAASGAEIALSAPMVTPFTLTGEKTNEGMVISGYVAEESTIKRLADSGLVADVSIARGAPENFAAAAAFADAVISPLDSGAFSIVGTKIDLIGKTVSTEAYRDSQTALNIGPPAGFELGSVALEPAASEAVVPEDAAAEPAGPEPEALTEEEQAPAPQTPDATGPETTEPTSPEPMTPDTPAPEATVTPPLPLLNSLANPPAFVAEAEPAAAPEEKSAPAEPKIVTPELPNLEALKEPPTPPVVAQEEAAATVAEPVDTGTATAAKMEIATEAQTPEQASTPEEAQAEPAPAAQVAILTPALPNLDALREPPTPPTITLTINSCRTKVAGIEAEHSILFNSGSTKLLESSSEPLDRLAGFFKACANVEIHIEGHTDSDGPENTNLALSVARAEAVVSELIARGVSESRLYAIGYGESKPIADNKTRAGKAQNRRIAFEILETAE